MVFEEKWEKWEPIQGLSKKYYIDSTSDNNAEFKILLIDENGENKVQVIFDMAVAYYERTDETFRLSTVTLLNENYGSDFYVYWTFFQVVNSEYIKKLSNQSYGISDSMNFIHFVFLEPNSILDVIASYEPKIEIIKL